MTQAPPMNTGGMRPHRGTMILVFGILSLLVCQIFGIVAWVMGNTDLQEMAAGRMDPSGEGLTKAGKILGIVSIALLLVVVVLWILLMVLGVGLAAAGAGASGGGG